MADLFWPGDERAGALLSEESFLAAMVAVEAAWLDALVAGGVAPAGAKDDLQGLVTGADVTALAEAAESTGNPAAPLAALLRERVAPRNELAARWLHRGLTSQDVVDTALVLVVRDAVRRLGAELDAQATTLAGLAETHRRTPMVARTLTQHAVPTTFGLKAAGWLTGVLDARDALDALVLPAQLGGAAGTRAAWVELAAGAPDALGAARGLATVTAATLGLAPGVPWHTVRSPLTRAADAAVACTDAWGHLANDVLLLGRPEVGELAEAAGGGSSTMPHKANPVLSVLVRRTAMTTPQLAATLHLAAASVVDERPDGAWHAEWATVRTLFRRTVAAAAQVTELVAGLVVHEDRMAANLAAAADAVRSEQRSMAGLAGHAPTGDYLGAADDLVAAAIARLHARPAPEEQE
jgi:3-carboxy-cis,cis-muconate cycloisomerase